MAPVSNMKNQRQASSPIIKAGTILDANAVTDTTLDCSFTSADEGESLTLTFLRLEEEEEEQQGLETPLAGSSFWSSAKNQMSAAAPVTPIQEVQCINDDETYPTSAPVKQVNVQAAPVTPLVDPDDGKCIEVTVNGVLQGTLPDEEGVEMDLTATRFILLDLHGAEVATTGKTVRFEIDGEDDLSVQAKAASKNRRKQIVKFLRSKSKKKDSTVSCSQVAQLALEPEPKPSILKKESSYLINGREKEDQQANKFTGVVIEVYDALRKAVIESYILCQYTGSYLEEQALDTVDTQYLRDLLDDGTVDLFEDANTGENGAVTRKNLDEHELNLAETFSFEVLIPYDETRENKPAVLKDSGQRTADM